MSESKFDLGDYVEVKDRIRILYELYGQARLVTEEVQILTAPDNKQRVMVKALAYRTPDDPHPGVGYSWMELPGTTPYTKGSELENTETSAWGRAIASLGILIDRSIASAQEVGNKQDESKAPAPVNGGIGSLVGTVITQGTQDFELRQGPDGPSLPFRIKEGKGSVIVIAHGDMAEDLRLIREAAIGARVTVWGQFTDESFVKAGKDVNYRALQLSRIVGPNWEIPAPQDARPADLSDAEMDGIFDKVPKAGTAA